MSALQFGTYDALTGEFVPLDAKRIVLRPRGSNVPHALELIATADGRGVEVRGTHSFRGEGDTLVGEALAVLPTVANVVTIRLETRSWK